ncbi:hypothetical protein KUTeg_005215 [Tegillarca granosa]|uniref:Uncharacterized protein n=1 Tax=Tegillarca granosa TaxID=220873 RepID=A0ABQ9FKU8_TEGGR|nr:hypothetical protein KUTeg_005215 [Tegillarca granosa]
MGKSGYEFSDQKRDCIWFLRNLFVLRSIVIVLLAVTVPIPLLIEGSVEFKCAYVVILMAILWLTEALPIPVTALMPIFLFPMLGVLTGRTVCSKYLNDTTVLLLGGLIVAVAVEEVNLHKRIALGVIKMIGAQPNMLMLGMMLPTWFLSMWISNTAAASMMLPIILAINEQVTKMEHNELKTGDGTFYMPNITNTNGDVDMKNEDIKKEITSETEISIDENITNKVPSKPKASRMSKGFALCVCYAASIGGISTLTGTPPNLVLQGQANQLYAEKSGGTVDSGISFAKWLGFALPFSIVILILSWIWLQIVFLGLRVFKKGDPVKKQAIKLIINREYKNLGKISFGEIVVFLLFICLAFLWVFRDIPGVGGWGRGFPQDKTGNTFVRDSSAVIFIAVLLFIIPIKPPNVFCWNQLTEDGKYEKPKYIPILNWQTTAMKVPWGVVLLLGGGFAMAHASTESGLSKWVGHKMEVFSDFEPWVLNFVLSCIASGATEVTSNSATATLVMPIVANLAIAIGSHPLYLMISATISCSFAFMLPVATPPNAMALTGIVMNILALLGLALAMNTWASPIFGLDSIPGFFKLNATATTVASV